MVPILRLQTLPQFLDSPESAACNQLAPGGWGTGFCSPLNRLSAELGVREGGCRSWMDAWHPQFRFSDVRWERSAFSGSQNRRKRCVRKSLALKQYIVLKIRKTLYIGSRSRDEALWITAKMTWQAGYLHHTLQPRRSLSHAGGDIFFWPVLFYFSQWSWERKL